jgi:hypothetical protein
LAERKFGIVNSHLHPLAQSPVATHRNIRRITRSSAKKTWICVSRATRFKVIAATSSGWTSELSHGEILDVRRVAANQIWIAMNAFGICFRMDDRVRFDSLRALFAEIKHDKNAGNFRDPSMWPSRVPDEIKYKFFWPTAEERKQWLAVRDSKTIAISNPAHQIGQRWDFYRVFEAIEESQYDLLSCEVTGKGVAELRIDPHAYPYGGVGPLIALAEAFGFDVLGVNECGRYESREQLIADGPA